MEGSESRLSSILLQEFAAPDTDLRRSSGPGRVSRAAKRAAEPRRANSRRGLTDPARHSYQPVEAVRRALEILRSLNQLKIGSVSDLHRVTGFPKPTIIRMLETLIVDDYVARDNLCGGYRVTRKARELNSGYSGISMVIDAARPWVLELTERLKWPIALGVPDDDAIALQFWTGVVSPHAHANTVLGRRPNLFTSAMGRAYLSFCDDAERERCIQRMRLDPKLRFGEEEEQQFRQLLKRVRRDGYATREPRTWPYCTTTIATPIRSDGAVAALATISFFTNAIAKRDVMQRAVKPLLETCARIEQSIEVIRSSAAIA
jgi:IclR family transcriptional regulator, mhp operon transcriptional activator